MIYKFCLKLNSLMLPWPVDWDELFGAARPLIVEIGFGYGAYLVHLAQRNPDASIIGLEVSNDCLTRAEKNLARLKLHNARVIHSTAETALHHLFEPATIGEIHINFPDPWFKRSHGHRRLMRRPTLDAMVSRLAPGGMLYLATDILDYADLCHRLLAQTPGLDNTLPDRWVNDMPGRAITKYESKAREAGRPCHYFVYRRNHLPAPDVPVIKDVEMPHIVFKSPLSLDDMLAQFVPIEYHVGETLINLLEGYRGTNTLLFDTYVKEPTIEQRVALMLIAREEAGEYTLKLGVLGHPRPTEGIHKAVILLGEWALGLHPESHIVKEKIRRDL